MTEPVTLAAIALDCPDPQALAKFYIDLIGCRAGIHERQLRGVQGPRPVDHDDRVDDYRRPRWPDPDAPQQVHLDFAVEGDVDAAQARAIGLGATKADVQPAPERWCVMLDPVGHPFCLAPASAYPS